MHILYVINLILSISTISALSCISDTGTATDWWFASKEPKGTRYLYADAEEIQLSQSSHDMNDTTVGALAHTMRQLWSATPTLGYAIFNDEPYQEPVSFTCGHTKGIWAWDTASASGIILTHSIPIFPAGPSQVSEYQALSSNAWTYAQNLACFSLDIQTLSKMAGAAKLTSVNLYDVRVPSDTPTELAEFANGSQTAEPTCSQLAIQTLGGQPISYFAKSGEWGGELYAGCISPALDSSLLVESWIRGSAVGPTCNGTLDVNDIQAVDFGVGSEFAYKEASDHSKWAVTTDGSIFCSSDINRMTTQYVRGGGSICMKNAKFATQMRDAITGQNQC
jgi:deoxyribonuclease-2